MNENYEANAQNFLQKFNLQFRAKFVDDSCPPFCSDTRHIHGMKHEITIKRIGGKRIVFPFWNSFNDAVNNKLPSIYDVLASISGEINCPDTFEGFCSEFGYEEDSRKAEQAFKVCKKFADKLNHFFTIGEREDLELIS